MYNQRFKAVLADVLPRYPKEKRLIEQAVDENIVKRIVEEPRYPSSAIRASLADRLSETYAIIPEVSFQLVDAVSYAVHGTGFSDGRTYKQMSITAAGSGGKDQQRSSQGSSGVKSEDSRQSIPGMNATNVDRSSSSPEPASVPRQNPDESRENELQPKQKKQTDSGEQTDSSPQTQAATAGGQKNNAVPQINYKKKIIIDLVLMFFGLPMLKTVLSYLIEQSTSDVFDTIQSIMGILFAVLFYRLFFNICMNISQKRRKE